MKNAYQTLSILLLCLCVNDASALFTSKRSELVQGVDRPLERMELSGKVVSGILGLYKKQFGAKKLSLKIDWENRDINAYAYYDANDMPAIVISGGMAQHKSLSLDGLALIACHEIGHFLGGEPKKKRGRSEKRSWSSAEGQADYFSVGCLARFFESASPVFDFERREKAEEKFPKSSDEVKRVCRDSLCERLAFASLSVAKVYAQVKFYSRELSLINPSSQEAYETILSHPDPQCRLDTMLAGILEKERPACWFVY